MPDLRTAKLNFAKKLPDLPDRAFPTTPASNGRHRDDFSMPSPLSQRQDSGSSLNSGSKPLAREPAQQSPTRAVPSMAFERNSYFRRLSTLPSSSISNTLPKHLICLIDSARSILFAVCQVYQTLEHYTIHAIDDRLSSVLRKVLDPASADMMQLINSLDRFDAMSRKMIPPPAVCRPVIESCKDTVAVFGKAVGVLALQLKVIATGDDVRHLRSMLLVLYGATAEIACAWQAMVPYIDAIKPLLHAKLFPAQSPTGLLPGIGIHEPYSSSAPPTTIPFLSEQPSPLLVLRSHSANGLSVGDNSVNVGGRTRTARRHAGSFSSRDVELGKTLPSYDNLPIMSGGVISGVAPQTPTLRTPKRHATAPLTLTSVTISSPSPTSPQPLSSATTSSAVGEGPHPDHSRQGSQTSLQASSSPSSPSAPAKTTFLELPSNSKTQVDKEALHAVQKAVEVAPVVWDMVDEILGDVLDSKVDVRESLERARTVTKRLSELIRAMQEGDPSADRTILREDAHVFLKVWSHVYLNFHLITDMLHIQIVVQLSNIIKTYGATHSVSSALRSNMVKLTNSTEEFAILLHVSSFAPSSTPRPHSPMLNASAAQAGLLGPPDENRLGASLSRSRSAQPPASLKLTVPSQQEGPRSALPTQSFKVPAIRRVQARENRIDVADPG